jgi:hypothetical protein
VIDHILRIPTIGNLLFHVATVAGMFVANEFLVFLFGFRLPLWTRNFQIFLALQILNTVVRDEAMLLPNLLYLAWCLFGKHLPPWDDFKKKLGSKLSSMTEVAKATFQRQQSEAFQ